MKEPTQQHKMLPSTEPTPPTKFKSRNKESPDTNHKKHITHAFIIECPTHQHIRTNLGLESTLKWYLKEERNAQTTLKYCKITEIYNVL